MKRNTVGNQRELTRKERKDLKILALFTSVYCRAHHESPSRGEDHDLLGTLGLNRYRVCDECRQFFIYAVSRRLNCPLDPKPVCKHCEVHCYRPGHREKVREIMRFSGRELIRRGRVDLLWHYLF